VRSYSFRVIEHDSKPARIIMGPDAIRSSEAGIDFYQWAREQWPPGRFTVELDPWSLASR
jgi:hypothetical protein